MENERCTNNRRSQCQDCGKAYVAEHLNVRKLEELIRCYEDDLATLREQLHLATTAHYAEQVLKSA